MNFWNKSKTQSGSQTNPGKKRQEAFEKKLEQIHFQARPDFREDLKARLMQNLAEQEQLAPAPGKGRLIPGLTRQQHFPAQARLALGGLGLAALALLLISILSVSGVYRNPTASASVAAGGVVGATPGKTPAPTTPAAGNLESTNILTTLKTFFDPAEAAKTVGFTVSLPSYLPVGYKLTYAEVNGPVPTPSTTTTAAAASSGYTLRFSDSSTNAASGSSIEITQWQVPFKVDTTGPTTTSMNASGTGTTNGTYPAPQTLTIAGTPAFIIQGGQWQVELSAQVVSGTVTGPGEAGAVAVPVMPGPVSGPITATSIISGPINFISGPITATGVISGEVVPGNQTSLTVAGPLITFAEVGSVAITDTQGQTVTTGGSAGVVVSFDTQDAQVKTLVWQQGNLFTVLTTPATMADSELKKIAESLKTAG